MTVQKTPPRSLGSPTHAGPPHATGTSAPGPTLTYDEFADRFQRATRILWAMVAGTLGRSDEIEDVLQEAAMIGLQRVEQFDPDTSFAAWMGRIARFVALNRLRMRQRRRTETTDPVILDQAVADRPSAATEIPCTGDLTVLAPHIDDELMAALARLRPCARTCLLLRALADLDYAAIGAVLGIVPQTAMSHVHRARSELQQALGSNHAHAAAARNQRSGNPR